MYKFWIVIVLFISNILNAKPLELIVNAEEAILINAKTGVMLFGKNEHQLAYPASTTKIATALLTLNKCSDNLDKVIAAERDSVASISPQAKKQSHFRSPAHWLETDGTHIGIKRGEELPLTDLLHAMLISSANDASNVIAQGVGGTILNFIEELNVFLKKIGCLHTHFNNPHGLHHPEHVTTAYDLSIMAKEALKDPLFCKIVSTVRYTCPQTNLELERHCIQTNQLLKKGSFFYPKAIGVKTGFTQMAGKNLVAAAKEGDRLLIAVALGYKGSRAELYQDVIKMFETAFNEPKMRRTLLKKDESKLKVFIPKAKHYLKIQPSDDLTYDFYPSEEVPVKVMIEWKIPSLPIEQAAQVGNIKIIDAQGNILNSLPLLASENLKLSFLSKLFDYFINQKFSLFIGFVGCVLLLLWKFKKS